MLQQTQVVTVIPYYRKWLKKFPTLASLARAPLSEVLKSWAGMGYYRRARTLHAAARHIRKNLDGKIPRTALELRRLPGIGRYTAGAIASIAFGEKTPVLDGNVIRILTRIFGISASIDRPATIEKLWDLAETLLPEKDPGDMNQALMELGATVCFPLTPQCPRCPVRSSCKARRKGKALSYPVRSKKDVYENIRMAALVLRNGKNEVWLEKQPAHGRWGGLWIFPSHKNKIELAKKNSLAPASLRPLLTVRHAFTKYRIRLDVYDSSVKTKPGKNPLSGRWLAIKKLGETALPSPHRKIAEHLRAEKNS